MKTESKGVKDIAKRLLENYDTAANEVAEFFLNKQHHEEGEPAIKIGRGTYDTTYWCAEEVGGVLCYNETHYYGFDDILTDLREDAPKGEIEKYNTWSKRCRDLNLYPNCNYTSWLHGAPRISDRELGLLEHLKADFEREIDELKTRHAPLFTEGEE